MTKREIEPVHIADVTRHVLPPGSRSKEYERAFLESRAFQLRNTYRLSVEQIQGLTLCLRVIAFYAEPAVPLPAVRKHLDKIKKNIDAAVKGLRSLLDAPNKDGARTEARQRILQASMALHLDECLDLRVPSDERIDVVLRLFTEAKDVADYAVSHAPKNATKAPAQPYPIACIANVLCVSVRPIVPSASSTSPFREIVNICYEAAGVRTGAERAVRAYIRSLDDSKQKMRQNRPRTR